MVSFIARQPIFNRKNEVIAYELLYRNGEGNFCGNVDGDSATKAVISNSIYSLNFKDITNGKKAFINFTETLILDNIATIVSKDDIVVELLETIKPTKAVIEACKELKRQGYILALDDFVYDESYLELVKLIDIIKVDFRITKGSDRKDIIDNLRKYNVKFLAEKVENQLEVEEALSYGYDYFQGYYFSKPTIMKSNDVGVNYHIKLKIIRETLKGDISLETLEELILKDVSLSYKLLKLINSANYGLRSELTSVKYAINLLGQTRVKKWLYIVLLNDMDNSGNKELLNLAIIRAKFCENIWKEVFGDKKSINAYLSGLVSLMDKILNCSIDELISNMCLPYEVEASLRGEKNNLNYILELIKAYERDDWNTVIRLVHILNIEIADVTKGYIEAIKWSNSIVLTEK